MSRLAVRWERLWKCVVLNAHEADETSATWPYCMRCGKVIR